MDIQTLTDKFNNTIKNNSWWAKYANSQFIQMIAIFAGQIIYIAQTYASRALGEGFISTATKRTSILAAAGDRGYVGRNITPSSGTVSVTNNSTSAITIPAGMEVMTNDQTIITITQTTKIAAGATVTGISASQYEKLVVDTVVETETPFLTVLLDQATTKEVASIAASVIVDGAETEWTLNPLFRMSRDTSLHYVIVYRPSEQIGVKFGNGSMGAMPPAGSTVRLTVNASLGDYTLAINQPLTPCGDYASLASILTIKNDTAIRGGAGHETTEETRNGAQYYVAYDEQVVWGGDYRTFVTNKIPDLSWLNVWGEQQQEEATGVKSVSNINKIFFSGHRPGYTQAEIGAMILDSLSGIPNELNRTFEYVTVTEKPFTLSVTGICKKSVLLTEAEAQIRAILTSDFGIDSSNYGKLFQNDSSSKKAYAQVKVKDLWSAIESLSLLISYDIELVGFESAVNLSDFVYLNVEGSTIDLNYP